MAEEKSRNEKVREIVDLLPRENCGKCDFENCGKFALAVVEGEASPSGCHNNPSIGPSINKVLGVEAAELVQVPAGASEHLHRHGQHGGHHGPGGHGPGHHGHGHGKGREGDQHSDRHHGKPSGH